MLYWSFFINRYVKMGLQFSLCPRVYRDDRYFNDLLSQLSVFRDENTEAQRLKRFTPDHITQVVAGRARLEPDHWTPGALPPGPCDLRALFRCLTSPVSFRLKLYVINGLIHLWCFLLLVFHGEFMKLYNSEIICYMNTRFLCGMLTALPQAASSHHICLMNSHL